MGTAVHQLLCQLLLGLINQNSLGGFTLCVQRSAQEWDCLSHLQMTDRLPLGIWLSSSDGCLRLIVNAPSSTVADKGYNNQWQNVCKLSTDYLCIASLQSQLASVQRIQTAYATL